MDWRTLAVDKHSPIPLYFQLAELIRERIKAGTLLPGEQLPSERDLSEQLAMSRMTARQALAFLLREGTLVVRPGVGTFVAEPKVTHDALHVLGFTEEMMQRGGGAVTSRVIEQVRVVPPPRVAAELELSPADSAARIVRLRLSADTPLLLETIYIPTALCPGLEHADLAVQSLYDLLEHEYDLHLVRARQTLEATFANDYESSLFGIATGMPMILLEGVTYLDSGSPAEYFKAVYRGDRVKFELESQRTHEHHSPGSPRLSLRIL